MTNETRQRLLDALLSCGAIDRCKYTAGLDFAASEGDRMVRDAVERQPGITGEALGPAAVVKLRLVNRIPEHQQIESVRNRLIHGFDAVDDETVCRHESS